MRRLIVARRIDVVGIERDIGTEAARHVQPRFESTAMMSAAPFSLAPPSRTNQSGPARRPRPESPTLMLPLSAPDRPVEKISGHISTFVGETWGIVARFARASGTSRYSAHAPLIVLPNRQPPSGPPHCEWEPFKQ